MNKAQIPKGAIAGANYTSDTRNYPWHRPPDFTALDDSLDYVVRDLAEGPDGFRYMSLLETGVNIVTITDIIVTKGIARGKWSADIALLLAGPVARLLSIMATGYDIKFDLGLDEKVRVTSPATFKELAGVAPEAVEAPVKETEESPEEQGFMAMASDDEQNSMLGYDAEDEEQEIDG